MNRANPLTATGSSLQVASEEFVWVDGKIPRSHGYLVPPTLAALREFKSKTVLDIGCGNGVFTNRLAAEGMDAAGCDFSGTGLELARNAYPGVKFFSQNIADVLPLGERSKYDAVVCLEVIEHLLQPRQLLMRAREALRPGGVFIVSTPYHGYWKNLSLALTNSFDKHWHPLRDFGHVKFFSRNTLCALMEELGFEVHRCHRLGRIPPLACSLLVVGGKTERHGVALTSDRPS